MYRNDSEKGQVDTFIKTSNIKIRKKFDFILNLYWIYTGFELTLYYERVIIVSWKLYIDAREAEQFIGFASFFIPVKGRVKIFCEKDIYV